MRRAYLSISIAVAMALIATAVYFARGSYRPPPVATPEANTVSVLVSPDPKQVRTLLSSPDGLVPLNPGESCPVSAYVRLPDPDFPPGPTLGGSGPLWLEGMQSPQSAITVQHVSWVSRDRSGFFLVRGRQLDGLGLVSFSAGSSADPTAPDLVLPMKVSSGNIRWVTWEATYRVDRSGCYGLSISSSSSAPEIIVFSAI